MAVISLELHDPQYQGFLDCPFDNLYGKPTLQRYIKERIPEWRESVIVSPDAGGAKRATAIADALGLEFSLIHKVNIPCRNGINFFPNHQFSGTPAHAIY